MNWITLIWRRLAHRIDPVLLMEAHVQAAGARAKSFSRNS